MIDRTFFEGDFAPRDDRVLQLDHCDTSIPRPDKEFFKTHHRIATILEVTGIGAEVDRELGWA